MRIAKSRAQPAILHLSSRLKRRYKLLACAGILLAVLFLVASAGLYYGAKYRYQLYDLSLVAHAFTETRLAVIPNFVKSLTADPVRLVIDINFDDYQKLAFYRQMSLEMGRIPPEAKVEVPATIWHENGSIDVDLRLKGDCVDHLDSDKWSFRVNTKGSDTLFGMTVFSLQHPKTRDYVYEWLFHAAARRDGIIGLRYYFVDVTINGRHVGIYALEEGFDKRLIENNQRREGPILTFDESLFWENKIHFDDKANEEMALYAANIEAHGMTKTLEDPVLEGNFLTGIGMLDLWRQRNLTTSQVFDIDLLARHYALSDLLGARHGTFWLNSKYYFNPVTGLLELIAFDENAGERITYLLGEEYSKYLYDPYTYYAEGRMIWLWEDFEFFEAYLTALEEMSANTSYLDALFDDLGGRLDENLGILYKDYPYFRFDKDVFYQNREFVRQRLTPIKGLHAYLNGVAGNGSILKLEVGNIQFLPLEILGATIANSRILLEPLQEERVILAPRIDGIPVDYVIIEFVIPEGIEWNDTMASQVSLHYRVLGTSTERDEAVYSWSHLDEYYLDSGFLGREPNVDSFAFLETDDQTGSVHILPGTWTVSEDLTIPEGSMVYGYGNTTLDLVSGAKIVSYSPLRIVGQEGDPFTIKSSDGLGQGLVVLKAGRASFLDNAVFNNLSVPSERGWTLTGGVTFYESPVVLQNCHILNGRAPQDDGLNIVRSEFEIINTVFENTNADCFDGDFVRGSITGSSFLSCGNDGLDISGSEVNVTNSVMLSCGDKGLSAGEDSQVTVSGLLVNRSNVGIAGKDFSLVEIQDSTILNCNYGFAIYQKKPEYGPSSIVAHGMTLSGNMNDYIVEDGSTLIVDGMLIPESQSGVCEKLYGTC